MSKLQILISQYNEDEAVIKPLLDSIESQCNIDLHKDIEVFIGNDGSDTKLSIDFLKTYTFPIQYHYFEHGGLAATRYKLQNIATADYIMFCDADDKFISTVALSIILLETERPFDALICDFLEEHKGHGYILHTNDSVFVHGKIYRRQFLVDNEIQWNPTLREHQDSAYNVLARTLAKNTRLCKTPLYMWCENSNSVSRKDRKYHTVNTWCAMLDSYASVIHDFMKRGYGEHSRYYAVWALYATYYEMAHDVWKEDLPEQKTKVYKRIVEFCNEFSLLLKTCPEDKVKEVDKRTKQIAERRGKINEMPPFDEWLDSILKIFKG